MPSNRADIRPWHYVDNLWRIPIPDYSGYPGGVVSLTSYLSANTMFGGSNKAATLKAVLARVAGKVGYGSAVINGAAARVFTGQGSIDQFVNVFKFMNENKKHLQSEPSLKSYFAEEDWIQAMIDGFCFGQDCIGFMGTYLQAAGVEASYVGRRPLDYTAVFQPVQSLDDIQDMSVVMLTNGMHIQIIDEVTDRSHGKITVDLCQSSSGGPQQNVGVTISAGGGKYLDVNRFRAELEAWKKANPGVSDNEKQTELRKKFTTENYRGIGFAGGAIFQLSAGGEPKNPVGGSVYVGTMNFGTDNVGLKLTTP